MQYSSEAFFFLWDCISENSSLQICVRIFPQSLITKSSSFWLCRATSATAVPAVQNSSSCDRRWMFWVLEIYMWILISDILLLIIVFVVGWTCRYFEVDSPRLEVSLLRSWFSKAGGLRLLLVGWRIKAPACWLEDYRGLYLLVGGLSCLLLVWLVLQVIFACCRSPIYLILQ